MFFMQLKGKHWINSGARVTANRNLGIAADEKFSLVCDIAVKRLDMAQTFALIL
jgi:hypothetical protein